MAEKRMMTKKVTDSDEFVSLSPSAQALYLHLLMSADDEGFTNQVNMALFKSHASQDDLKVLIAKQFLLVFESGVIVIRHWKLHNCIRADRLGATVYQEEKAQLGVSNGIYDRQMTDKCLTNDGQMTDKCLTNVRHEADKCPHRLDKNRLDKNRLDKNILSDSRLDEIKEIISYLNQKAGTSYRYQSEKTQKLIRARFNEGFEPDDFYRVIDNKCNEWLDTNYAKYLRPETLFSNKFEGYLNQKPDEGAFGWMDIEI